MAPTPPAPAPPTPPAAAADASLLEENRRLAQMLAQREAELQAELSTRRGADADEADARSACVICLDAPKSHVLLPCGHKCLCGACAAESARPPFCPICRAPIGQAVRVFE